MSSLDPDNVEKLVFLHDNTPPIHLPYKRVASQCIIVKNALNRINKINIYNL